MNNTTHLRQLLRSHYICNEADEVAHLVEQSGLSVDDRQAISAQAVKLVNSVRDSSDPQIMESFLAEYGLSSEEGVALMCLAEALLRVPDNESVDALIHDKIVPADWGTHLGNSSSSLVNASTWALMLTGKIISDEPEGIVGTLRSAVKRLGEPVVRTAVSQAIKELGNQFVLGESIKKAVKNSETSLRRGYTFSYDMLGEAALTEADAKHYHLSYSDAISTLGSTAGGSTAGDSPAKELSVAEKPGISIKLSALYPRYEFAQKENVLIELVARTRSLAMLAKSANMGFNIDAEEADRLDLSLDVIEAVLAEPSLAQWDGFGIVVQAYSPRAIYVIEWLYDLAVRLDRKIMIRLVKGAYWDTEIKRAQVLGLDGFPVFTQKAHTDVSYITCAAKLLQLTDRIYPQFATHNAHTIAAILHLTNRADNFEFQRLHGMGEAVHQNVLKLHKTRCRIYAPVGAHEDLLAYLVRRLLENGANSSFVNQIVDETIPSTEIAADPFPDNTAAIAPGKIPFPSSLYMPERINSAGLDITDPMAVAELDTGRNKFREHRWYSVPIVTDRHVESDKTEHSIVDVLNPADHSDFVGTVQQASSEDISLAFANAENAFEHWSTTSPSVRKKILESTADLYEQHSAEFIALATREAGKTVADGIAEIREAVDFLRFYAVKSNELLSDNRIGSRGIFVCISPWNFPLAIFTGQIAAAIACGNCVIAKPAEQTALMAYRAVQLFLDAGLPPSVLQLLPGKGNTVGSELVSHPKLSGVCFTGSTATAQVINKSMALNCSPTAPLIAETGGLNAMIIDSTALPEQAIRDVIASAFQSAGQRCSALRVLFVQEDVFGKISTMLFGAMDLLRPGNPWNLESDLGPVIDQTALEKIEAHINIWRNSGNLLHQCENLQCKKLNPAESDTALSDGTFVAPTVLALDSISQLKEEIFGPVLHLISYAVKDFEKILHDINATGYALTFGLHTRVDERVQDAVDRIEAGNLYINRNQIGAIVGSQPFGGKALSGTGPKAGGPHYLLRFVKNRTCVTAGLSGERAERVDAERIDSDAIQSIITNLYDSTHVYSADIFDNLANLASAHQKNTRLDLEHCRAFLEYAKMQFHETVDLPGPTGESNRLSMSPAGLFLCLDSGYGMEFVSQVFQCLSLGNSAVIISQDSEVNSLISNLAGNYPVKILKGSIAPETLTTLSKIDGVLTCASHSDSIPIRVALSNRTGPILPLSTDLIDISPLAAEKSLCIDTTAAGGNASLLAENS